MERELEQLEGTVEDIIYQNEDNGYTVFEVSGGGVVTVVCGVVGELHAGESVVCRGRYENHATYGRQFHAQECETDMPKDLEAVYAFLASRSLPYIGARTADKIIDKFGAAALEVIANDPAQLTLIPGISADKADRIQQEFKRMFGMRELIAYLAQFEISPRRAMEVFRTFGPGAMTAIQQNPYLLCGEPLQLDFRHADSIAQYYQMAGGLRPAAGSRPPAHPPPQRGQRPHLPAPRPAAGHGLELHPPAPPKSWTRPSPAASGRRRWRKKPSTARNISTCPTFWPPSRTSPTVWPC
ncbi:helix-hairpin-helix domain-containing protein [Faecalibacterium sp.]|uniref:YrrC family ATP-dependent DNA helicase n=1 Tax=Faecalibacterium sp. TaxID=1971605 RepID=UPI00399ADFEB